MADLHLHTQFQVSHPAQQQKLATLEKNILKTFAQSFPLHLLTDPVALGHVIFCLRKKVELHKTVKLVY